MRDKERFSQHYERGSLFFASAAALVMLAGRKRSTSAAMAGAGVGVLKLIAAGNSL